MKYNFNERFRGIVASPDCVNEILDTIIEIGIDYDGCHDVEGLKGLIDEFIEYAYQARDYLNQGKFFEDEELSAESLLAARKEKEVWENSFKT